MHRKFLKLKVMAAIFWAAFCWGTVDVGAYTYSGITMDTNENPTEQPIYDNTDLIVKDSTVFWKEINCESRSILNKGDVIAMGTNTRWVCQSGGDQHAYGMLPVYITKETAKWISENLGKVDQKTIVDLFGNEITCSTSGWEYITYTYNDGKVTWSFDGTEGDLLAEEGDEVEFYPYTKTYLYASNTITTTGKLKCENSGVRVYGNIKAEKINIIGGSVQTPVSDNNVQAKEISVEKSGNLLITRGNISADSIYGPNFLTSYFKTIADYDGVIASPQIKATKIQADYDVMSKVVTAGGVVKANAFNVGVINASTVTATKNQDIEGNYSLSNQASLTGGLAMNRQKIAGVGDGVISAISTDLVNGVQLYNVKQNANNASAGTMSAGSDISISSTNAISINKIGGVSAGDSGILSGGVVYTTTNAMQTSLEGIASTVSKNSASITSLEDTMGDLKKSVAGINSTVTNTTKNLSSSLSNRLQTDLGNLSDDGKSVIKNLIAETLRGINVSSASIVSSNEASLNNVSISSVSIMPAPVEEIETVNPNVAKVDTTDVDSVYDVLDTKVGKTDFEMVKAGVDSNATAIATNVEDIKTNTSAIDTLKTSKANADASNLNLGAYSAKLGTGKIEKDNAGLVTGGTVYGTLDQKADASYVEAGLGVMSKQLDSVKQTATRDMNRMGANAAALTSLHPQNYDPADKLDFSAGYGHYHNSNATAVGAFYRPNASTMVSLAGTVGNGDSMVSAGLSFKLGMNANVEKVMISKDDFSKQKAVNQELKGHLDNQTARLQQMEAAIAAMISR